MFGVGFANFSVAYTQDAVRASDVRTWDYLQSFGPHNLVIGTMIELGPIGLLLLALFVLPLILRRGWGPDAQMIQAALASLFVLALFLDILSNRKQVWLILGLAGGLAYLRRVREKTLPETDPPTPARRRRTRPCARSPASKPGGRDRARTAGVTDALWVTPGYPWAAQPVGGVFYQTQARALARRGLDVTVASPTPWAPWPLTRLRPRWREYAAAPATALDEGVTVIRPRYVNVPGEPSWAVPDRLIARSVSRARSAWTGASVVHGHSAVTGMAAWRLARANSLPLVLTFHGSDLNVWPDHNPGRLPDLRAAVLAAEAVITVSAALARRVEEITGVTAIHLPLGSDHRALARLAIPRAEARATLDLVDDRIVVLFVGNLLASKGVRELADALVTLDDRFLGVFVGDGPERGYGLTDLPGGRCLQYRGAVAHDEIPRYLSAADVLVLPSHGEGLPTVLVEAGSLGLPVIASAVGGIPGLLGADRGVILREISADAVVEALVDFESHRTAAEAAAARLRAYVLAEHDVDTNAGRLLDIYASIGAGRTTGSGA